ncbi:unnamed protein product (macronuclear) [Paramecium tetraurelia]|uniref:VHS domain-containing protein n=1 Tax=Paramecium tetraurelia TaxID=5888 RepID=A0BS27_PARTE|nr:uncharacterized protein GSPATT00031575001 [Paramecium tetraurelia]CAK61344.1 unnamed protein product [Paramecium tetraurelia]|eukprot:XP_001428742.1 hypothetical protein (macronuclear) [Paramecium tetraurelia strain d4-2]
MQSKRGEFLQELIFEIEQYSLDYEHNESQIQLKLSQLCIEPLLQHLLPKKKSIRKRMTKKLAIKNKESKDFQQIQEGLKTLCLNDCSQSFHQKASFNNFLKNY